MTKYESYKADFRFSVKEDYHLKYAFLQNDLSFKTELAFLTKYEEEAQKRAKLAKATKNMEQLEAFTSILEAIEKRREEIKEVR